MRTTVTIDDALYRKALALAEPGMDKADLFREAVKVYVRVQSTRRLAALGGTAPDMKPIPRRRSATGHRAQAQPLDDPHQEADRSVSAEIPPLNPERHVRLFRNGRNQAVRIPREFELEGDEAIMIREEGRLVIIPVRRKGLLAVLAGLPPLDEDFPEVDAGLPPLDDVTL